MAEIKPFAGWRYNADRVRDLSKVVAPPYDVISKKGQCALYRKSPYNVVRLILGRKHPKDTARCNQYTRARSFLDHWKRSGIFCRETAPAIYIYVQDYKESGRFRRRIGFMAAMRLNRKEVLRHENTLAAPKKDRLALLKEVKMNLSPVFGLFEDPAGRVQNLLKRSLTGKPAVDVTVDGVRHRLFVEKRPGSVESLCRQMRPKPLFIADGHHRFDVACQFKDFMRSKAGACPGAEWNYVMTYFSDCQHNSLAIYPTHRLLSFSGVKNPLKILAERGVVEPVAGLSRVLSRLAHPRHAAEPYHFGFYTRRDGFFIFTLDKRFARGVQRNPVKRLDVAVLHQQVIEPCFNIGGIEKSRQIDFTRDAREAFKQVRHGRFTAAFFVRPTSLKDMLLVSKKGLKMPQKSTYFYPKLLSGLVFRDLEQTRSVS